MYARSLEMVGDSESADREYSALRGYSTGPRASLFYAKFLRSQGREASARDIFTDITRKAENAERHYNNLYREIITEARRELRS